MPQPRFRGRRLGERFGEIPTALRETSENGIRERDRPLEPGGAYELHGLVHRRVARDAVQERELIRPESQCSPNGRIEPPNGPAAESLDQVVESARPLDGAKGKPLGQRLVARVETDGGRPQRAIRIGLVLEDAPQDVERDPACRGD